MTLDAVKANVSGIFAPGHLYVALSRVRCSDAIQVVGFNRNKVIRLPQSVKEFYSQSSDTDNLQPNLACCKRDVEKIPEDSNDNMSHLSVDVNYFDDVLSEEEISEIDEIANACFANENATDQRSEEEEINFR